MNIRRFIIALLTFTLIAVALNSEELTENIRFVTADVGLRMRIGPELNQRKLGTIPFNAMVKLIEEHGEVKTIAGATGRWSKVEWKEQVGWVFGGFLAKEFAIPDKFVLPVYSLRLLEKGFFWPGLTDNRRWFFQFENGECAYGYQETSATQSGSYNFDRSSGRLVVSGTYSHYDGEEYSFKTNFTILYVTEDVLAIRTEDDTFRTKRGEIFKFVRVKRPY